MRSLVVVLVLCAGVGSRAAAQADDPWLIVPSTSAMGDAWMSPVASRLRTELLPRGTEVWPLQSAAAQFAEEGSAPAAEVTDTEISAWEARSREALWRLVMGEPSVALDELNDAQELSRRAIEVLNRDEARARKVLDTCLFMVRALLETGFASDANDLGRECRALVPVGEPSPEMHPARVREVLQRVDTFRSAEPARLEIDSTPSGCSARVNGLAVGNTPVEVADLLPAQYRVQVECDPEEHGRVHIADASAGSAELLVDARFDRSIETKPLLHLRYPDAPAETRYRRDDAEEIRKAVPSSAMVLISMPTPRSLAFELVQGTPLERAAFARIPSGGQGPSRGDVALAARALVEGKCVDFSVVPPAELDCGDLSRTKPTEVAKAEGVSAATRMPRGKLISGLTLTGVGGAALVTGYVLLAPRARAGEDWVGQLDSGEQPDGVAQQRWLDLGTALAITSAAGAAALVTAMPLVLPKRNKPPWWAWLSGGIGVGLGAFSIAYGVTAESAPSTGCSTLSISSLDAQTCVRRGEHVSLAILTGVTAAPLLTIPLVYLFRRDEMRLTPAVELSRGRGYFSLSGEF